MVLREDKAQARAYSGGESTEEAGAGSVSSALANGAGDAAGGDACGGAAIPVLCLCAVPFG